MEGFVSGVSIKNGFVHVGGATPCRKAAVRRSNSDTCLRLSLSSSRDTSPRLERDLPASFADSLKNRLATLSTASTKSRLSFSNQYSTEDSCYTASEETTFSNTKSRLSVSNLGSNEGGETYMSSEESRAPAFPSNRRRLSNLGPNEGSETCMSSAESRCSTMKDVSHDRALFSNDPSRRVQTRHAGSRCMSSVDQGSDRKPDSENKATVVVLRNFPQRVTQRRLLNTLLQNGFERTFDIVRDTRPGIEINQTYYLNFDFLKICGIFGPV